MKVDHSKHFRTILVLYVWTFSHMGYNFYINGKIDWNSVTVFFEDAIFALNSLQFVVAVYFVYTRCQVLNEVLRAFESPEKEFAKVQALSYEILHIVQLINEVFGFQMLAASISKIISGIFVVFISFEAFVLKIEFFLNIAPTMIYYASFDTVILFIVCTLTSLIAKEVKNQIY